MDRRRRMTRRDLIQLAAGGTLGTLGTLLFTKRASGNQMRPMEICQWFKLAGPVCSVNGQLIEYWGWRCCYGGRCDLYHISERVIGSC